MKTLSLAWRNLLRNRRRSLMTLTAMVLGLMAILLFGGYIRDINYAIQTDCVKTTGHLQIQHKDYFRFGSGNPAAYGIANYERIITAVKQDPELASLITVVTPTLQFGGIAGNFAAGVSRTVWVHGSVVEDQARMRLWNDYGRRILSKHMSLAGTPQDSAVIGTGVARVLQLCSALNVPDCPPDAAPPAASATASAAQGAALDDDIAALATQTATPAPATGRAGPPRIEILATNAHGAPNVSAVSVLRAEFQGVKELDDVAVSLHLPQAQRLIFGAAAPQVTAIVLQLKHTAQIPQAQARLDALLKTTFKDEPLAVIDYETLNPFYGQTLAMFNAIFSFISVLIGAIVLFTVTNTMSMAIIERTVEIGTLRAIGLRQRGIRTMFVTEGVMLGGLGAVLGLCAAVVGEWLFNLLHLSWIPPGRVEQVALSVRLTGENGLMIGSAVALVVVAALSALIPAARAARMNIVEALRHV